jgi:hypothetical protein
MKTKKAWTVYVSIFLIILMMVPFLPQIFNKQVGNMALSGWIWLGICIFIPVLQWIQDAVMSKGEDKI